MRKLANFNFDTLREGEEYYLQREFGWLKKDKVMSDGFTIDISNELVILRRDDDYWQVETVNARREPAGVVFWVKPEEIKMTLTSKEVYNYQDLLKIKSKIFGYSF